LSCKSGTASYLAMQHIWHDTSTGKKNLADHIGPWVVLFWHC